MGMRLAAFLLAPWALLAQAPAPASLPCENTPAYSPCEMAFDLTGIEAYFDASVCSDESPGNKPSPDPIFFCLQQLGVEPEAAAYVGDSPTDMQAAHAAGVDAIAVTWGVFDTPALEAEKPDVLVHTIPQLLEVLGVSV